MPKCTDISSILVIGQAAVFDYSGTQAIKRSMGQ